MLKAVSPRSLQPSMHLIVALPILGVPLSSWSPENTSCYFSFIVLGRLFVYSCMWSTRFECVFGELET